MSLLLVHPQAVGLTLHFKADRSTGSLQMSPVVPPLLCSSNGHDNAYDAAYHCHHRLLASYDVNDSVRQTKSFSNWVEAHACPMKL